MTKRTINPFEYAQQICEATPKGVLITTKAGDEVDTMIIGWGQIGTLWGRPTFTAFVRSSRHTYALLDSNPEFTINVPLDGGRPDVLKVAGTKSGRDLDKIAELGLTLVEPNEVSVPAIAEYPLTLECKVLTQLPFSATGVPAEIRDHYYPAVYDFDKSGNAYYHVVYFAEIVDAYICE